MKQRLLFFTHPVLNILLRLVLCSAALATPLTAMANNSTTLVDGIEVVRRNQQLFVYLHSNAPVVHQSLETNEAHLTLELEQINLSPTVKTTYLNAPNVDSIMVKQLPNHKVRVEIDGSQLSEPIVGFRELSGKIVATQETVSGFALGKPHSEIVATSKKPIPIASNTLPAVAVIATEKKIAKVPATPPTLTAKTLAHAISPPAAVIVATALPSVKTSKPSMPLLVSPPPNLAVTPPPPSPEALYQATPIEEEGNETPDSAPPNTLEALLLQLIIGASHHLDWCIYAFAGTIGLGFLASWGLKRRTAVMGNASAVMGQGNGKVGVTQAYNPAEIVNNINAKRLAAAALKEALPPTHQRILDRVQRQMEGTSPSIPNPVALASTEFKSTPKMPVSQASRQYQQQQQWGNMGSTTPKKPAKLAETTNNNAFNRQGERLNQKVVRPWQPERLEVELPEVARSAADTPASGEAFLESINAYLDPESQKNIQQGLRNNKRGL